MVVSRDYMLKQKSRPSAPKQLLDTKLIPAVVNILGAAEVALDRGAARTGVGSATILAGAAGLCSLGAAWLLIRGRAKTTERGSAVR